MWCVVWNDTPTLPLGSVDSIFIYYLSLHLFSPPLPFFAYLSCSLAVSTVDNSTKIVDMKRRRAATMMLYFSAAASAKVLRPSSTRWSRLAFQNLQRRSKFTITAPYPPTADQPQAIKSLVEKFERGDKFAVLRGCTGTGKICVQSLMIVSITCTARVYLINMYRYRQNNGNGSHNSQFRKTNTRTLS
jgi:hypothetical protein